MEDQLEAEHMPFYIQDLRTNEIIAFHAFLTSLSDSYSVNWDKTVSYGRADPVKTYNNTSRTIGMTFMVVATSPADFDEMWWKINKLVTMVYPQYSPGTSLAYGEDSQRITAPFSQIPTASPLVRLRLGDLFKSNYSRFSLARLFGLDMYDHDMRKRCFQTGPSPCSHPSASPRLPLVSASPVLSFCLLVAHVWPGPSKSCLPQNALLVVSLPLLLS